MQLVIARLMEVVVAALLAGVAMLVFSGLSTGVWPLPMLFIVPLGFAWSMFLGAMAAADISRGLFLVAGAVMVLALYLLARFVQRAPVRVVSEAAVFVVHQMVLINLFAMQGISTAS